RRRDKGAGTKYARWLAARRRADVAGWGWGRGARGGEAPVDGTAGTLDRFWRPADDVLGIGQQQRCLDLERDLGGIFGGVDRTVSLSVPDRGLEPAQPVGQEADEPVTDGAGLRVDLGQDRGEEAAAREG